MSTPFRITEKISGFNPKSVDGLQLWLDASDTTTITQDGSTNVSQWRDKSINGYQAVQNTGQGRDKPTFVTGAQNYVSLAPNQALVIPTFSYTTSWSVFCCMNNVVVGGRWLISPFWDAYLVMMGMGTGQKIFNGLLSDPGVSTGPHIEYTAAENTNGTGSYVYYRDGTIQASNNTSYNQVATILNLGIGANATYGDACDGTYYMYEILIYNSYLSDTERQNIESYLAQKWAMTANLPAGNPVVSIGSSLYTGVYKATERTFDLRSAGRCALWLDASDVNGNGTTLADQTTITQWIDKSGNNRSTTVNGTIKYNAAFKNGKATLSFSPDDSSSVVTSITTAVGNDDYALMAVWKLTVATTVVVLDLGPNANSPSGALGYNSSGGYNFFEWGVQDSFYSSGLIGYVIQIGTRTGGIRRVFINGNSAPSGTSALQNIIDTTVTIGNGDNLAGFPVITGEICELAIFNSTITQPIREQLEGYFAAKWSIPLVAGHPYSLTRDQNTLPYPVVSLPRKITSTPF
jgi:hypothetical protein